VTHPKSRSASHEVGGRDGFARAVTLTLVVMLAIVLTAGCSPASVADSTPPAAAETEAAADAAPVRGSVTVYHEPT
jgi:hypothetical protein